MSGKKQDNDEETRRRLHLEDLIILVSVGLLFWLGVFHRHKLWAQIELVALLIVMLVVFIRRVRRTYRAFRDG